jgi:uncharacterized protein (TIGR03067 family)
MRAKILIVLAAGLFLAAESAKDDAKDELKKFEGTWVMVSGEEGGQKLPDDVIKSAKLTIMGDKHTVKAGKNTLVGTHAVNPTKKPKTIDSTDTEGPFKNSTILGIYEVNGDQFKVCFAKPGDERPKEFSTKIGTGSMLHVWKREKK